MKLSVLLAVLVVSTVWAQPDPDTLWTRIYEELGEVRVTANCIQQTFDGGYIISGWTNPPVALSGDILLVRLNEFGDTLWTKKYEEEGFKQGFSVQQTPDEGFIVACFNSESFYLMKTDANGDTLWTRTGYSGFAYDVQLLTNGGYIVGGYTYDIGAGHADFLLAKYDSAGNSLWQRTYGGPDREYGYAVSTTLDGGYVIVGRKGFNSDDSNWYVVKTDSIGNMLWDYEYGGSGWDVASGVVETPEGDYVVAGWIRTENPDRNVSYIVKFNSSGDTLWTQTGSGLGNNSVRDIRMTSDGGYICTGQAGDAGGSPGYFLLKLSFDGDTLWTRIYQDNEFASANSGLQTSDGGFVLAGFAYVSTNDRVVYVVKTGPDGGSAAPLGTNVGIPGKYVLHPVYPNPFNAIAVIKYEVPVQGIVRVGVYDVLGRKVATLVDGQVGSGSHQVVWDAGEMPSGVYFVQMVAGDFRQVRKVVLLK